MDLNGNHFIALKRSRGLSLGENDRWRRSTACFPLESRAQRRHAALWKINDRELVEGDHVRTSSGWRSRPLLWSQLFSKAPDQLDTFLHIRSVCQILVKNRLLAFQLQKNEGTKVTITYSFLLRRAMKTIKFFASVLRFVRITLRKQTVLEKIFAWGKEKAKWIWGWSMGRCQSESQSPIFCGGGSKANWRH